MREIIKTHRQIRKGIVDKTTTDEKRTGVTQLSKKIQESIADSLADVLSEEQDYFDTKITQLSEQTNLSKEELTTLFNKSLSRLFLMLYRSVDNNEILFKQLFTAEDINGQIKTLLFDFYRMGSILAKKTGRKKQEDNRPLSKIAQKILSDQLPYLDVSRNVLSNQEIINFFNLSTVIKVLSRKGNETENYLNFCFKLGKEFLKDESFGEYFYPSIIKTVVIDSGDGAEKYLKHIIEVVDEILQENTMLKKYSSKKLIGRIVSRRGAKAKDYLESVNAYLRDINIFLDNILPKNYDHSATMIKITHLVLGRLKSVRLTKIKNSINEIENVLKKIDWSKYYQKIRDDKSVPKGLFKKYNIPKNLQGIVESIFTGNVLTGRNND